MRLVEVERGFDKEQSALLLKHEIRQEPELLIIMDQLSAIRRECKPFLEAVDYKPFEQYAIFRGIKNSNSVLTIEKDVRLDDRRPLDTNPTMSAFANDYFETYFGEPFRNSMFATGSADEAKIYGFPYLVFPAGEFTFLWSPSIEDLFSAHGDYGTGIEMMDQAALESRQQLFIDNILSKYTAKDFKRAILSRHEIMIRCSSYYGILVTGDLMAYKPVYTRMYTEYLKAFT